VLMRQPDSLGVWVYFTVTDET